MLIRIARRSDAKPSEITPKSAYLDRRRFMQAAGAAGALALGPLAAGEARAARRKLDGVVKSRYVLDDKPTDFDAISGYNNFYEFGTGKTDPAAYAKDFKTKPWTVEIAGEAAKTGVFDCDDVVKPHRLEERVYRLRCVEAWSMIVPWVGIPLADVIKRFEPAGKAKYVAFQTLHDPKQMPGQRSRVLDWPYVEGLRMDEAMHPLALLAVGLYGEALPNQNGAPIRLVVPWKYGFKSIKSIVRIAFVEKEPPTSWNKAAPSEYGFYSNVNPNVPHPRWSQAKERRIGDSLFAAKRDTLMFNGYAEEVAHLYAGMDLKKQY
jgi:sulfoxide reductase catalytic subunit YedY